MKAISSAATSSGHALITVMTLLIVSSMIALHSVRSAMLETAMAQAYQRNMDQMQMKESTLDFVQKHIIPDIQINEDVLHGTLTDFPSWELNPPFENSHPVLVEFIGSASADGDPGTPSQAEYLFRVTTAQHESPSSGGEQLSIIVARTAAYVKRLSWQRIE